MIAVLYIGAVIVGVFLLSGVLPRFVEWRDRVNRVQEFQRQYRIWTDSVDDLDNQGGYGWPSPEALATIDQRTKTANDVRSWLAARRNEMQRDAEAVGKGVMYVAPPPIMGGRYKPHAYFLDLFDAQTNSIGSRSYRLDDLVTIVHEAEWNRDMRRRDLYNPAVWIRLAFERLVRFPAYVLRTAGFSDDTAASSAVKVVSAAWSLLVGGATIAGFVLTLIRS